MSILQHKHTLCTKTDRGSSSLYSSLRVLNSKFQIRIDSYQPAQACPWKFHNAVYANVGRKKIPKKNKKCNTLIRNLIVHIYTLVRLVYRFFFHRIFLRLTSLSELWTRFSVLVQFFILVLIEQIFFFICLRFRKKQKKIKDKFWQYAHLSDWLIHFSNFL